MKNLIFATVIMVLWASVCAAQCKPDQALVEKSDAILNELASLPLGIDVFHAPSPVKALPWSDSKFKYKWSYATTVQSRAGSVEILEFGSFYWSAGRWVFGNFTGEPFTANDFSEWYSCPDATLVEGESFADPANWSGAGCLRAGKSMWYYIGVTQDGSRVKGEAVLEELAELLEDL